jgi:hypothetical protein
VGGRDEDAAARSRIALANAEDVGHGTRASQRFEDRDVVPGARPQQGAKDRGLDLGRVGRPERMAEWVGHHEGARRLNLARDLRQHRDGRGGDAAALELRLNQADRLMAEGSNGHEERDVHPVIDEEL